MSFTTCRMLVWPSWSLSTPTSTTTPSRTSSTASVSVWAEGTTMCMTTCSTNVQSVSTHLHFLVTLFALLNKIMPLARYICHEQRVLHLRRTCVNCQSLLTSEQLIICMFPVSLCTRVVLRSVLLAGSLYIYQGSDAPGASSDGRPSDNSFYGNTISNTGTGVKIAEADDTVITGETIWSAVDRILLLVQ